jgi:hypothetical protein
MNVSSTAMLQCFDGPMILLTSPTKDNTNRRTQHRSGGREDCKALDFLVIKENRAKIALGKVAIKKQRRKEVGRP